MGIYSHLTDVELTELRAKLVASLTDRLTTPSAVGFNGRNVAWQQRTDDLRRELAAVADELAARQGQALHRPIHVI